MADLLFEFRRLLAAKETPRNAAIWLLKNDHIPLLQRVSEWLKQFDQPHPLRVGYESFFSEAEGNSSFEARLMASSARRLGRDHHAVLNAERELASAIFAVVKAKGRRPPVISRRASALASALEQPVIELALRMVCEEARISADISSFAALASRATAGEPDACGQLVEFCEALKPHLDPRGPRVRLSSATHELLLAGTDRGYSYSCSRGDVDRATQATRIEFGEESFDPRPAFRRLRRRRKAPSLAV
jgi:hypothetical protein